MDRTHATRGLAVLALILVAFNRASAEETSPASAPVDASAWVGSNYTPAYASNQVQMWHDFRPEVIDKELAAAKRYYGINTLRVYLHNMVYDAEKETFLRRIEQFLTICRRHGIRPGFTFFDDCHRHSGVTLEPQPPVKGYHNGRWAALQDAERKDDSLPKFKQYVQDVVRAHREDPRVLWWEVYNEPNLQDAFTVRVRELAYGWAKECRPRQPVIACWDDHPYTDVVNAHNYSADFVSWNHQAERNPAKGTVFTEAGARWMAPRPSNGEPCEVIHWLAQRKTAGRSVPGVYLCWELMAGNSNCRWYWDTPTDTPEPTIPWCGLMWPDATPVSLAEAEAIHRYTTGTRQALFFEDFQEQPSTTPAGWTEYGASAAGSRVGTLAPHHKLVAGDPTWTDYVLEAVVMLKAEHGNAGVIFRVNQPGPGSDEMDGYYVGFDTKTLYLGKMNNNWQPLATFDLSKLDCRVVPGVWNLVRVAVEGKRIRVWFDRMHPSADPDNGLRIDFTDEKEPVLSGCIGLRTAGVEASFDNVVVLPVSVLKP
jgi:hypothetical protein